MVVCCVPHCGADSWKCDGSITFYDFPSNPDLAAKWIQQINTAVKVKPMWFPRGKPVICSKHFLHTDFKGDTDSLKPRCVPTVFGHRYIGSNPEARQSNQSQESNKSSPLIVKVIKPQTSSAETNSNLKILDVRSEKNSNYSGRVEIESTPEVIDINDDNLQSTFNNTSHGNCHLVNNTILTSTPVKVVSKNNVSVSNKTYLKTNNSSKQLNSPLRQGVVNSNFASKQNAKRKHVGTLPKVAKKKEKNNSDLIEIGPNTFLKINPEVIKVNRKQTPSGNTVLQFLMDQKLARSYSSDLLPKLIQGKPSSSAPESNNSNVAKSAETSDNIKNNDVATSKQTGTVQHVLGHVVDTHVCKDSQADIIPHDEDVIMLDSQGNNLADSLDEIQSDIQKQVNGNNDKGSPSKTDTAVIEKAPVLLTTNMPLSHCFIDKPKYILQLKQKSRQIASMKMKISSLTKKVEELEDRCIVQERQLSYSFIKRLKTIRKNASKGDACATYILEQIRSYSSNSNNMRWSDSTLEQCAVWCRKAPYAYEYFKKADFFKLPCLGTVKRFIRKHPEIKFQKKAANKGAPQDAGNDDDESSSDFDFDDSDDQNDVNMSDEENAHSSNSNVTTLAPNMTASVAGSKKSPAKNNNEVKNNETNRATESISIPETELKIETSSDYTNEQNKATSEYEETNVVETTIDSSNLELQEIMLPSGEVVQCYSTNISNGTDIGNQYYIIPNVSEQNSTDREYSVVSTDSLPLILQNIDASQLQIQNQDQQLIFIANSSGQVECNETVVTSA